MLNRVTRGEPPRIRPPLREIPRDSPGVAGGRSIARDAFPQTLQDGEAAGARSVRHAPSLAIDSERPVRPPDMTRAIKVRLRFAKCGDLRLVSHHDIMRCLERMLRRARVPMAVTQGFNPRPKMTFALALGLGVEARREVVDLELSESLEPSELLERLSAVAPPGFDWVDARALPPDAGAPRPRWVEYQMPVRDDRTRRSPVAALEACSPPRPGPGSDAERIASNRSTCARISSRPNCRTTACSASASPFSPMAPPGRRTCSTRSGSATCWMTGPSSLAPTWISRHDRIEPGCLIPEPRDDGPSHPGRPASRRRGRRSTVPLTPRGTGLPDTLHGSGFIHDRTSTPRSRRKSRKETV